VTPREYAALVEAVRSPLYRGVLALMYGCGLRISEAVSIKVTDIDGNAMTLRVIGKGNKERLVPLSAGLLADLRRVWLERRHPVWLFPNRAGTQPLDAQCVEQLFRKVRRELNLSESLTPHSLRHGFAMRLYERQLPTETIAILMGHKDVRTTKIYLHLTEAVRAQVQEAVAGFHVPLFG
jgi:site-specific recombinase XerD